MNILILDTETTGLVGKNFCYNLGYAIYTENGEKLLARDLVIEQVWNNLPLFQSAYYAEKRNIYVERMRARKAEKVLWGFAMRKMSADIRNFAVSACYAFNSNFDDDTLSFNSNWFKTLNALDDTPIFDIWGYSSQFIANTKEYLEWAKNNEALTDTGNLSANAENLTRFLNADLNFQEEHTALADSEIEARILFECLKRGAKLNNAYEVIRMLPCETTKTLTIKVNKEEVATYDYNKKIVKGDTIYLTKKEG
jgi:hypothetical protein